MNKGKSNFYTTAPSDYDGFGTVTVRHTGYTDNRGREAREVSISDEHWGWQASRYGSGLYPIYTPDQFEVQCRLEFLKPTLETEEQKISNALALLWRDSDKLPVPFIPMNDLEQAFMCSERIAAIYVNSYDTSVNLLTLAQTNAFGSQRSKDVYAATFSSKAQGDVEWFDAVGSYPYTATGRTPAEAIARAAYLVLTNGSEKL